jgi:hypothetical protein
MLEFVATMASTTPRIEAATIWATRLLEAHAGQIAAERSNYLPALRGLMKTIGRQYEDVAKMLLCDGSVLTP